MSISPSSRKRKAWDLNPHDPKVARFSKPARRAVSGYLPYISVDPPGIEPGFPVCRTGVFPLGHEPLVISSSFQPVTVSHLLFILCLETAFRVAHPPMGRTHGATHVSATFASSFSSSAHSGPDGSRTHHTDLARVSRPQRHAGPLIERSVRESNPVPLLTEEVCYRNTYRPSSDPGWSRTSTFLHVTQAPSPLDHGTMLVIEAGVEPAKSPGSRPGRFACLRTRPWRVRVSHLAGEAHETSLSAGPPASSCRPRYRAGHTGHDQPSVGARVQLGACQACNSSQGESCTPTSTNAARRCPGHDGLNVARLLIPPLGYVSVTRTGIEPVSASVRD